MKTENTEDTFISHLVELRSRLIRAASSVLLVFLLLFYWAGDLYALLAQPLLMSALPEGGSMIATDIAGLFWVPVKVTLMVAFLITLPYVLYQVWAFVAPGLYRHEKQRVLPLVIVSVLLFFAGMALAYFLVFPAVFRSMFSVMPEGVAWMTDIDKYLSLMLTTFMALGLTFEVPVAVILLTRAGAVQPLRSTVDDALSDNGPEPAAPHVENQIPVIGAHDAPPEENTAETSSFPLESPGPEAAFPLPASPDPEAPRS
jgi:sec-independent protein translocase protein TatC